MDYFFELIISLLGLIWTFTKIILVGIICLLSAGLFALCISLFF